jgi:cytidylate kinase
MESEEMTKHEAVAYIQRQDEGRERFLRKHFKADINDPLLYHLTLNTGLMPYDRAAEIIGREILARQAER